MRRILGICSAAALACFLLTASSFAQQKSLKEQIGRLFQSLPNCPMAVLRGVLIR
jgi:hypothetical protein